MIFILATLGAFTISAVMTAYLASKRSLIRITDVPNNRSMHDNPVPRTGGIAVFLSISIVIYLTWLFFKLLPDYYLDLFTGLLLVFFVSLLDDIYSLRPSIRIFIHLIAAWVVIDPGNYIDLSRLLGIDFDSINSVNILFSVLFLVWMINLYNFMDGMDGFASGMAVIGFIFFAIMSFDDSLEFSILSITIASASAGFMLFNYPPASIFLGDTGSTSLGLLAGYMILVADSNNFFTIWSGILVFSPFVVDATVTLIIRLIKKEKIWKAHNRHFYQRLASSSIGRRRTLLFELLLMSAAGASALISEYLDGVLFYILGVWVIIYAFIIYMIVKMDLAVSSPSS